MEDGKFVYESVQDNETVSRYLESFVQGFRKGKISLKTSENEINLEPNNLLQFQVKSEKKGKENKISLKISWTSPDHAGTGDDYMEIE
jgi:amphi-Trp domain-containing protein